MSSLRRRWHMFHKFHKAEARHRKSPTSQQFNFYLSTDRLDMFGHDLLILSPKHAPQAWQILDLKGHGSKLCESMQKMLSHAHLDHVFGGHSKGAPHRRDENRMSSSCMMCAECHKVTIENPCFFFFWKTASVCFSSVGQGLFLGPRRILRGKNGPRSVSPREACDSLILVSWRPFWDGSIG